MKNAYVSFVVTSQSNLTPELVTQIDQCLSRVARVHEIVLVIPHLEEDKLFESLSTSGPVTVVTTMMRSTRDQTVLTGLARAVGDFVIEWRGFADEINESKLSEMLLPTDQGIELVIATSDSARLSSRIFLKIVNLMRPKSISIQKAICRTYSRHALQHVLNTSSYETNLDVIVSEVPLGRRHLRMASRLPKDRIAQRFSDAFTLLSRGTRFGTTFPLLLAIISTFFGLGAATYSFGIFLLRGRTPEGWTTLMIAVGIGQAAILTTLAFTWSRMNALTRGLSRSFDSTARVFTVPPKKDDQRQ